jgi:hypothetical protein
MRDMTHSVEHVVALSPQSVTGTISNAPVIDRAGYEAVDIAVLIGAISAADGSNFLAVTLRESDNADMSGDGAVAAGDLIGSLPVINNTNMADTAKSFGYIGNKRYLRVVFTETGTFSALVSADAVLGFPRHMPVS